MAPYISVTCAPTVKSILSFVIVFLFLYYMPLVDHVLAMKAILRLRSFCGGDVSPGNMSSFGELSLLAILSMLSIY
jgi:hypothetical protein